MLSPNMRVLTRAGVLLLVTSAAACGGGGSTPSAPTSFSVTVSSPNTNVLFGATEQMTAAASDGRALAGTWTSDNSSVATVSAAGLVTPTGAGQATITFTASSGQSGTKLLRGLPTLAGTFGGTYTVTSCAQGGDIAAADVCSTTAVGTALSYVFTFTQSADVVSGKFFLGTAEFDNVSGTISLGGTLSFSGRAINTGAVFVDSTWNLSLPRPNSFGSSSTVTTVFTATGLSGSATVVGSLTTLGKSATVPQGALPLTIADAARALSAR